MFFFFFYIFAAFHFGARECRVDEFLADTIPRSFVLSFFFLSSIYKATGSIMFICLLATRLSLSFQFSRKFWGAKVFIGSRAFFFLLFFLSLFPSRFSLIYTSENGFWLWAYRRMGKHVGSSIMNNCILYGFWRFLC